MDAPCTRRDVLRGSLAAGACLGLGGPAAAQLLHTPADGLDRWHRAVCGLCGLADPLFTGLSGDRVLAVKGDPRSPDGLGRLCTRGMAFPAGLAPDRRPAGPRLRRDPATKGSDAGLVTVDWDEAWRWLADRLGPLLADDPGKVATFLDHGLPCESLLVAQRLLRGHLGCATVESQLRLDAMAGLEALEAGTGIGAPVGHLGELDGADLFWIAGADPAERHATLFYRMAQCQRRSGTRTVLIDPRRTLTAGLADVFVRPRPGTDRALLRGIGHLLVRDGAVDDSARGLPGYDALRGVLDAWTPARVVEATGVRLRDLQQAAASFAESAATFTVVGRGLMRQGTDAVRALVDLHLLTGRLGDGSTILPLLDGANAMGGWLLGSHADRLPGLRRLDDEQHRRDVAERWSLPPDRLPSAPGIPLGGWLKALQGGELEALIVLGSNLLPLLPDQSAWRQVLADKTLVLAIPVTDTESEAWADLVLPMTVPWLEEPGCHVSAARRVLLTSPGPAPASLPSSFQLLLDLARTLLPAQEQESSFEQYVTYGPELAWEHARQLTAGRPCDLTGMTYERLADVDGSHSHRGLLWPWPEGTEPGDATEPASARLTLPATSLSTADASPSTPPPDDTFDLVVFATSHHSGAREITGHVPELHHASPRAWVEITARDALPLGIRDGGWVCLESAVGRMVARAWFTDRVGAKVVAVPEHYGFRSDREGGTDGRAEAESLPTWVYAPSADPRSGTLSAAGRVTIRPATDDDRAQRALRRG